MNVDVLKQMAPLLILVLFFYFAMYRPQKKKETRVKDMRANLAVGDNIISIGGIMGKVIVVKEDMITIETGVTKTRVDLMKWAVGSVVGEEQA
ncbi:MAG: preprotein translocase subunit YajC [Tissierellia bacterium]|nr:preprotein translocase subunit YajC [Tissierellia bacterium]